MKGLLLAALCLLAVGCGRMFVASPERVGPMNSPDWNIRRAPARQAPPTAAAPAPTNPGAPTGTAVSAP